ncbi:MULTISPECIES: polyprenyl synthetase family protein [Streptomyces]|uniref:polyprenyl synthetase family protein n=1 Tax=Streptomyces TaxID=1883 RepID=UPI00163CFF60|nr:MULTISPECIES: polyprenyl synthetase family protein [Streptomyces]MBC2878033.1 polyprenyl synthetase family protein [Streptomyces sp. TYQ1024]UBI39988.1 polyprenyl synthetase family protein [Streptomyces mobaraensis]UKW32568.1 polyprenyl synthetase family protein [Streptomyces sp. TYQ1024]
MNPSPTLTTGPPDLVHLRRQIEEALTSFVNAKRDATHAAGMPAEATEVLAEFVLDGGKRLRPLLCLLGWHTVAEAPPPPPVVRTAAALEIFHDFCLIHDDVMDHSALRRGHPTVHRILAARHRPARSPAGADELGAHAAVLVGDLAFVWSDELLHTAGLTPTQAEAAWPLIDAMHAEVIHGQYLDLIQDATTATDLDAPLRVILYKTAKYTVERPLHIGAALAGGGPALRQALTAYALPLGEAFQLRDDLLGVFGDPTRTGKPNLDDLREGKHTVLIAHALHHADSDQRELLRQALGDPGLTEDTAARVRAVLVSTGARATVEQLIRHRCKQALNALDGLPAPPAARHVLHDVALAATVRQS